MSPRLCLHSCRLIPPRPALKFRVSRSKFRVHSRQAPRATGAATAYRKTAHRKTAYRTLALSAAYRPLPTAYRKTHTTASSFSALLMP